MWDPEGTIIVVCRPSSHDFKEVDRWLIRRLGKKGKGWDRAATVIMRLGRPGVWQEYAVVDPDVAFEFKMVWG
jgi:hypothetical protein